MGSDSEAERTPHKDEKKKIVSLAPIAKPLAGKKLSKRTLKLVRRAGNISPIDVITHVPILCEESDIPYIYVASKEDLANAGATKRPTCCVLVLTKPTKGELGQEEQDKLKADYTLVVEDVKELASSLF
ncbi:Ribonucloprotein [Citrus sinensis]|nr:Ribonucloprotein [Citrus sinensis]